MSEAPKARVPWAARLILDRTARHFGYRPRELIAHKRHLNANMALHVAMYVAHEYTASSYPEIGRALSRDHTTVMHGVRKIARLIADEPDGDLAASVKVIATPARNRQGL